MNAKYVNIITLTVVILIASLLTGCVCSTTLADKAEERTSDVFHPFAVFRQTGTNNFALEGTRQNHVYDIGTPFHAYLFIPDYLLISAQLQTNETLSLEDVEKLETTKSHNFPAQALKSEVKLPAGYVKINDLPENDICFKIEDHYPFAYLAIFLPGATATDIVTFPYQMLLLNSTQ